MISICQWVCHLRLAHSRQWPSWHKQLERCLDVVQSREHQPCLGPQKPEDSDLQEMHQRAGHGQRTCSSPFMVISIQANGTAKVLTAIGAVADIVCLEVDDRPLLNGFTPSRPRPGGCTWSPGSAGSAGSKNGSGLKKVGTKDWARLNTSERIDSGSMASACNSSPFVGKRSHSKCGIQVLYSLS